MEQEGLIYIYSESPNREETESPPKEIMVDFSNFTKLIRSLNPKIQEAQWIISRINIKKYTPRNIIVYLKTTQGKEISVAAKDNRHPSKDP